MRFVKREKRGDVVARLDQIADWGAKLAAAKAAARPPHSQKGDTPCFLYVWQGKDLQEGEFVCVAAKGVTGEFCGCVAGKGVRPSRRRRGVRLAHGAGGSGMDVPRVFGKHKRAPIVMYFTVWIC